jgi:pimeloyl-ACP methyl ester carboxylesterase
VHLTAGGHRLEYRIVEPLGARTRDRTMIVLLHEGLGSVAMWKDFPDAVAASTGHPVLVYSRHGYGQSAQLTQPRRVDYMHFEATTVLPELLSQLEVCDPLLIGHSDGASIAIIHAGSGNAVSGLILMAPHVFVEQISIDAIAEAKRAFETTGLAGKLARYHKHPESMFRGWNDIWLHAEFRDWNIESFLPAIHSPLVVIQGENDPYGTLAQVDAIERSAGGAVKKLVFPDCGHSPHIDCREKTLDVITDFVRRLDCQPRVGRVSEA